MTTFLRDFRYAWRSLTKRPGFLAVVLVTLAVGLGASSTIFSVVDSVVLRGLPYDDAGRLVQIGSIRSTGATAPLAPLDFFELRDAAQRFDAMAASRLATRVLITEDQPVRISSAGVTPEFFDVLGASPLRGRAMLPEDDDPGAQAVALISFGAWQTRFGGDPAIIGTVLQLSGVPYEVIGVMPANLVPPEAIYHGDVELWFPLSFVGDDLETRDRFLQAIGKMGPGVSLDEARAELGILGDRIAQNGGFNAEDAAGRRMGLEPLLASTVGTAGGPLLMLLGAVGFLLLIVSANVANLFLARATAREREMGVRTALGASRGQIVRLVLAETLLVALIGGAAGIGIAYLGVDAFIALSPDSIPRLTEVGVDWRILGFGLGTSLVTGLLFGVVPAVRMSDVDPRETLQEGGGTTPGKRHRAFRQALVFAETALTVVLVVGAALLINSFVRLSNVDPGFDPSRSVRMAIYLQNYETGEERSSFFAALLEQLRAIPSVEAAGVTNNMPMTGNRSTTSITVDGTDSGQDGLRVDTHRISDGFFASIGARVVAGRDFATTDDANGQPVAIVNEAFARQYLGDREALGARFRFGGVDSEGQWYSVIGVSNDLHQRGLGDAQGPSLYTSFRQSPAGFMNVVVRTSGDLGQMAEAMQRATWSIDPVLPLDRINTVEEQAGTTVVAPRFYAWLLGGFATVAFSLAIAGIYGTVAYGVGMRVRELGIRVALGASGSGVVGLVVRQGMVVAVAGIVVGVASALVLSRVLTSLLYDISPVDVVTYASSATILLLAAAAACYVPARRAARVDPITVLRAE